MYASIVLIELMLLVTAIVNVGTNRLVGRKLKWEAIAAFSLVAAAALAEAIAAFVPVAIAALAETGNILSQSVPLFLYGLHQFARLLEFCCAPLIGVAVAIAFGWTRKPLIPLVVSGLHVVFQLVCFPLKLVFSVDRQNVFHRELLYPAYVAIFLLSMAYCFLAIIRSNRRYHSGNDSVLMMTLATILTGILIETCSYGRIRVSYLAIAVSCQLLASRSYQLSMQMDGVTELLNRQCYKNCLSNLHSDCVIIFFDINKFKEVNDTYGHAVGDYCLKRVAEAIQEIYQLHGGCYRVGGDEFCVILRRRVELLDKLNDAFLALIEQKHQEDCRIPYVALGFAFFRGGYSNIQAVVDEADAMMYKNKKKLKEESPKPGIH